MKAIAINGSPRKNWNTAQLLDSALAGAAEAGFETERIDLYDIDFRGCVSCFGCKRQGHQSASCVFGDGLAPVLQKVLASDVLFLGAPIYFGDVTGEMRCFLERLMFPVLTYDDFAVSLFEGRIDCAFFYTMNAPEQAVESFYADLVKNTPGPLAKLNGTIETFCSCDTLQFGDYSKYHAAFINGEAKAKRHEEVFPKELEAARELGRKLAMGRKG